MKILYVIIVLFLVLQSSCSRSSSMSTAEMETIAQKEISSPEWMTRDQGIATLQGIGDGEFKPSDKTRAELLNILKEEVKTTQLKQNVPQQEQNENSYADYMQSLTAYTATQKIDEAIPLLFKLQVASHYHLTPLLLAPYGIPAFDFLAEKSAHGTEDEKRVAINALSLWLSPPTSAEDLDLQKVPALTESQKAQAIELLVQVVKNKDTSIRLYAVTGLETARTDPKVREVLLRVSKSDPEEYIRGQARRLLEQ